MNLKRKLKFSFQRSIVDLVSSLPLLMVMFSSIPLVLMVMASWALLVFLVVVLFGSIGVGKT